MYNGGGDRARPFLLAERSMTHVSLDGQSDAVKEFVLGLMGNPEGSMLELNGKPVGCLVSPPIANGASEPDWTDTKNARRIELIDKKYAVGLSPNEHFELFELQNEMERFRNKVAPRPLAEARQLYHELLMQVASPKPTND
jgi:hypothetical protein